MQDFRQLLPQGNFKEYIKNTKTLLVLLAIFLAVPITVFLAMTPQRVKQFASTSSSPQAASVAPLVQLTKNFSSGTFDHLYTTSSASAQLATVSFGYQQDDILGNVYTTPVVGTVQFHRLVKNFPDGTWDHFYTISSDEVTGAKKLGYTEENEQMYIYPNPIYSAVQITRMTRNMPSGTYNHYYTNSPEKIAAAQKFGYKIDGTAGYILPQNTSPVGYANATCQVVSGWVCDADDFSKPVNVSISYDNTQQVATTGNDDFGSDTAVKSLCGGSSQHAFSSAVPDAMKDGRIHSVSVYGVNFGQGQNAQLGGSPANIKCGDQTVSSSINHILSTGQSLSWGADGMPPLSTTQPYNNLTVPQDVSNHFLPVFTPLVEWSVESMSSSMANDITASAPNKNYVVVNTKAGQVGYTYDQLKKGVIGPDGINHYNVGLDQVRAAKAASDALHLPYHVTALTVIHGESDNLIGTSQTQYESDLVQWQHDYETDIQAISGQQDPVPMFTDQMSSFTAPGIGGFATSTIPLAQLAAAEDNPGKIYLVTPKYFLTYTTNQPAAGVHLTNYSYRRLGEYYAKVYKKVIIDHQPWKPLSPTSISRSGNVITAVFSVPVPPIQLDTTHDALVQDAKTTVKTYGFEYYDNSATPPSITSVAVSGQDTIKIILSAMPTGGNQQLRYAYTGTPGAYGGGEVAGSIHGNVHDSDQTKSQYTDSDSVSQFGDTLPNWLIQFSKSISQ